MKAHFLFGFCLLFQVCLAQNQVEKNTEPIRNTNAEKPVSEPARDTVFFKQDKKTPTKGKEKKEAGKEDQIIQEIEQKSVYFHTLKSNASTQSTQRSPSPEQQKEMNNTVSYYGQHAPNSFEYHYFKYIAGNYNVSLVSDLLEAQKIKPNNVDVHVQLAAYHFIKEENAELKKELEFLLKNKKLEGEVLTYATDILNSVEKDGTLMTHGFDDTYSVMYLQKVKKIRSDVRLVSADFLQSEHYRANLAKLGYQLPAGTVIDVAYVREFCRLNTGKNLQLSMTFPKPYLKEIVNDLQILGLTFAYKKTTQDIYEKNQRFYLDKLDAGKVTKYKTDKCKKLSSNYLPFLMSLEEGYEKDKNKEQLKEIQGLISKIKTQANVTQSLKSY